MYSLLLSILVGLSFMYMHPTKSKAEENVEVVETLMSTVYEVPHITNKMEELLTKEEESNYEIEKGYGEEEINDVVGELLEEQEEREIKVIEQSYYSNSKVKEEVVKSVGQTYYDTLSEEERYLIEIVVQHEVGGLSKKYRVLIAELIYNRLKSDKYPNDVKEMLFAENQFPGVEEWYASNYEVDDLTREVVKEVFSKDETSHEAVAYYNPELSVDYAIDWFENSGDVEFLFEYEEESWGVNYRTRFFK